LFDHFIQYSSRRPDLNLVLIGKRLMPLPKHPRIHDMGFVSPEEKNAAMARAVATVHPSHLESLCMAALESMAVQTPILVQASTDPLRQHCLQGQSGLYFSNAGEFAAAVDLLLADRRLCEALGRNGLDYVLRNYTWSQIIRKYEIMFNS